MAPGPKRKRGDGRTYSQDDSTRPSPHRPQHLPLAYNQHQNSPHGGRGGGDRRQSRGGNGMGGGRGAGRGASSVPQSPNFSHASPPVRSPAPSAPQPPPRPVQPAPSASAPPKEAVSVSAAPTREVPPSNEYLTPQRIARWNNEARQAILAAASVAQRDGDVLALAVIFHEIIEASIDRQLSSGELGSLIRDIVSSPTNHLVDPVSTFLDSLSALAGSEEKQRLVRHMLMATEIDVERMRVELDAPLLQSLGLVRTSFNKMAVRKATHALYRQSNYNLLREETEGYSKLMTEYFTTVNSEPPSHDVVSETYQRVNALIGAFDLDIGRVLDVTLDVFANLLVKHGKFFVKFLRSSAWWPEQRGLEGIQWEEPEVSTLPDWAQPKSAIWYYSEEEKVEQLHLRERRDRKFWDRVGVLEASRKGKGIEAFFELGARRITSNSRPNDEKLHAEGATLSDQQAARKWADDWMSQTGTLPPASNDTAAHLLGFKLQFYASDARSASDFLPDNLIHLAALLIKVGFISVLDLYPHLYPPEAEMSAHHQRLVQAKKDKEEKQDGKENALTMSVLTDDSASGPPAVSRLREAEKPTRSESESGASAKSTDAADAKSPLPEPADQKYQLLKSLLCIGALPEALFILGLHPWLFEVYSDLLELVSRLAHHSLSKVYEAARPIPSEQIPVVTKGSGTRPSDFVPRRTLRWPKPDQKDAGDGIDYRFYWEDWADNVPVCQNVDDVIKLCTTLLGLVGPDCGQDTILLTKIARIARKDFTDDPSDANRQRWIKFSTTFLAPALSFTGQNPGVVNEVWELLKQFDTATRFTIYDQWQIKGASKPAFRQLFKKVNTRTSKELNKVTTTNVKESGRKIAKISYSNPGIVFKNIVTRLIGYPNMIDALVECSKYITLLGYDVLTWTLVTTLTNSSREGKKGDGMFAQGWLTNLSLFIGRAYQRYALLDPTPVLQYTTHQLLQSSGELYMLDVLEQMVKGMGGIGPTGSLSESTVLSLSAGPVLRAYTLQHNLSDNRHQAVPSAKRLAKCLRETNLAPQILVALAQHVEAFIHRDDMLGAPDKVVFFNADKLNSNFYQYLEFLRAYISEDDFDASFPGLIEMISDYGVDPTIAFTVCRASIAAKANAFRIEQEGKASGSRDRTTDGDIAMEGAESSSAVDAATIYPATNGDATTNQDVEMDEAAKKTSLTRTTTNDSANAEIENVVERLKAILPDSFADHPCLSFYVTFWQLSLPDVDQTGIKERYREIIQNFQRQAAPVHTGGRYNSRIPKQDTVEQRRAKEEITKLNKERDSVAKTTQATQDQLRIEMSRWFADVPMIGPQSDALHLTLLQDCFIPRSRMSLHDAQYTSSMLMFMHGSGVPGFRMVKLLDFLFNANKLSALIGMYSEEEAKNFGRFLNDVLRELQKWHDNKNDAYARFGCGGDKKLPGFGKKFDAYRNAEIHLDYTEFCHVTFKWHKALFTALKGCVESGIYSEIRNAISVLNSVSSSFPKVDTMREELQAPLERIAANDERDDLKISAQSTFRIFKQGKTHWRTEWQFRNQPQPADATYGISKAGSQTPQPKDALAPKLNASAPVFKSRSESNGTPRPTDSADEKRESTPATPAARLNDRESSKANVRESDGREHTPSQQERDNTPARGTPSLSGTTSVLPRPDRPTSSQTQPMGRPSHALPIRPDSQPPRSRPDRQPDYGPPQGRHDSRPPNDYGRLDRPLDQRDRSVPGGRTPERGSGPMDRREYGRGDPREYEDRAMRAPPRDARGPIRPPPQWEPRDSRDSRDNRDHRERLDHRGHPVLPIVEPRRSISSAGLSQEYGSNPRDVPPSRHQVPDRADVAPSRLPPANLPASTDGPAINPARAALIDPAVNPQRAALINETGPPRHESPRADRDGRRERGSRPQSPRRGDERRGTEARGDDRRGEERGPPPQHSRSEAPRDHREERVPPQGPPHGRDRREEVSVNSMPTGPRGSRNEPPFSEVPSSSRGSREMFQPGQSSRQSASQSQDPNYGRLNAPSEPTPSGPRSDRREAPSQPPPGSTPSGPASANSTPIGMHPSRYQANFGGSRPNALPIQTDMSSAPSGPRSGRTPQGPLPSPGSRGPPTGPAFNNDRGPRNPNPLRTINNVLNQNAPSPTERNAPTQGQNAPVIVRGRGANRVNGSSDGQGGTGSAMPPPQHVATPGIRAESQPSKSDREGPPSQVGGEHESGRSDSRSRRSEARREERAGRERDHEKRSDDRSSRNGPSQRGEPGQEQERGADREKREKRGSDRESSRRHGEREGERSSREGAGERPGREPREPRERGEPREPRESKPHRSSRDEGRPSGSGREERDRRSRDGGANVGDDGRKRVREPTDQPHGDMKRRR